MDTFSFTSLFRNSSPGFRLSSSEKQLLGIVLLMKVALLLFGIVLYAVYHNQWLAGTNGILQIWNQWDSPKYINIARLGYQTSGDARFHLVFYPGYPALIATGIYLGFSPMISSFVVATIASFFVVVLLYRLASLDEPDNSAFRGVCLLLTFPTAYFLHVNMTESPFLAFTLGALLAARKRRWLLAGVLGFFAVLTRVNGLVLLLALAIEVFEEWRLTRQFNGRWLFLLIAPLAIGIYLYLNYAASGNPLQFMVYQREHWNHHFAFPWQGAMNALRITRQAPPVTAQMVGLQEFVFLILGLIGTIACCIKMRLSYGAWMLGNWLMVACMSFLVSTPRYLLIFFPMFLLLGRVTQKPFWFPTLTYIGLLFYALFASMYVQGGWAF